MVQYYGYATGRKEGHFGLNYNIKGIIAFTDKKDAEDELKSVLDNSRGLEGVVIDLTPLVQQEFILKEKLHLID